MGKIFDQEPEKGGPGLFFILLTLVIVAVVGARYLGFYPVSESKDQTVTSKKATGASTLSPQAALGPKKLASSAVVAIYHSHGTESYAPGDSHTRGEAGEIIKVGEAFKQALADRGVVAVQSQTLHDFPVFKNAYQNSLTTITETLAKNPSIRMVFDIHRDGLPPETSDTATTFVVSGQRTARLFFLVGDQDNPHRDANLAFAKALDARSNQMYPGLSKGVKVSHGNYNEQVFPQAVSVFIGSYPQNTVAEAENSARLLADVVAAMLEENVNP
ncbi:MAG: stage II sporulation protein P [Syntrophothermus sp.]